MNWQAITKTKAAIFIAASEIKCIEQEIFFTGDTVKLYIPLDTSKFFLCFFDGLTKSQHNPMACYAVHFLNILKTNKMKNSALALSQQPLLSKKAKQTIAFLALLFGSIILFVVKNWPEKESKPPSQNTQTIINSDSSKPGDQRQIQQNQNGGGGDNIYIEKQVIDQSKKIYNKTVIFKNDSINNLTIKGNVDRLIVPEDKEISFQNNWSIKQIPWSNPDRHFGYLAKPRQGTWSVPFFAFPADEDSAVDGILLNPVSHSIIMAYSDGILNYNGRKINMKVQMVNNGAPANSNFGYAFTYTNKPSILVFGDYANPKAIYFVQLKSF